MAKNFLDKDGLDKLWSKICSIFAPNWLAYRPNTSLGKTATNLVITHNSAMSSAPSSGNGANIDITLPSATTTYAGLLSADDKQKLNNLVASGGKYKSNITDLTLKMPNAVGGIAKDTTVSQLNDKTYNEMFDALLFPSVRPSNTTPSVGGFALSSSTSPVIIGSTVATISAATLNKGEWTQYNTTNNVNLSYAGNVKSTSYKIIINGTEYNSISGLPSNYTTVGDHTYNVTISYGKGPSPKDNKGVVHDDWACPAGSISASRTINVTYPIYATTQAIGTFTQLSLKSWTTSAITSSEVTLVAQGVNSTVNETTRQAFLIPYPTNRTTTVKIEWYNDQSNKWEDHTSQFSMKTTTKTFANISNPVNYRYYYYNSSSGIGDRKFKITF